MAAEKDNKLNIKTRQILGYFGALPFLFLSIFPLFLEFPEGYIFNLLLAFYGGVILSFLGGMTWGWEGEADNNTSLIFGIVVSLIGFLIIAASNSWGNLTSLKFAFRNDTFLRFSFSALFEEKIRDSFV